MATPDKNAAWTAGLGVTAVAIAAAAISFEHVSTLARQAGETAATAWLLPLSMDGAIVAAVAVVLTDSRCGRRPAASTIMLLGLGLAASLAANVASAEPAPAARAVAAWPPIALALGIEVLSGLIRRTGTGTAADSPPASMPAPAETASFSPVPRGRHRSPHTEQPGLSTPTPTPTNRGELGQPAHDDAAAIAVIRTLDAAASGGLASRLEIQKALRCGGSRASRLASLARSQ